MPCGPNDCAALTDRREGRIKSRKATRRAKKMKSIKQEVRTACEERKSPGTIIMGKARVT